MMKKFFIILLLMVIVASSNAAVVMTGGDAGEGLTIDAGKVVGAYNFAYSDPTPVTIQGIEFADDIHNPWVSVISGGGGAFATFPLYGGAAALATTDTADDTSMLALGNTLFYGDHDSWVELSNLVPGQLYQIDIITSLAGFAGPRGIDIWVADNWGDPLITVDTFEATATDMYNTTIYWTADADGQLYVGTAEPEALAYAYSEGGWINGIVVTEPYFAIASDPAPAKGETDVELTTTLTWNMPDVGYTPAKYVLSFRNDPNWVDTASTTVIDPVVDLNFDADPDTVEATVPVAMANLAEYFWKVDSYESALKHEGATWSFTTVTAFAGIVTDPESKTVPAGISINLSVAADNATSYQWYKDGSPINDAGDTMFIGENTATLAIVDVQLADEGYYDCEVDNVLANPDISAEARVMIERKVAQWTLDGTLAAVEDNPAENWDGDYIDPNSANPNPNDSTVVYVTGADGVAGSAAKFDGEFLVEIPGSEDFFNFQPQGITVTAWILGPSGGDTYPVYKHGNYAIGQHADGLALTLIEGGGWRGVVSAEEGSEGEWRFVATTYNAETGEQASYGVYDNDGVIDVLLTELVTAIILPYADVERPLYIGGSDVINGEGLDEIYEGAVDDVRIYNYALTASDLQGIYASMTGNSLCMDLTDPTLAPYDYNNDCEVTLADFAAFAGAWLNSGIVNP